MEPVSREEFNAFHEVYNKNVAKLMVDVSYLRGKADEKDKQNSDLWSRLGVVIAWVGLVITWFGTRGS